MSTFLMGGTRLRLTNVASKRILRKRCFIKRSFALGIRLNCVLKHFNRRKIHTMISHIRLEVDACLEADELHNPRSIGLQYMRILSCINKRPEEEVGNIDGS